MPPNRWSSLVAIVAAAMIILAVTGPWFTWQRPERSIGIGPLGVEECAAGACASAWWSDVPALSPGPWALLGAVVAAVGALAGACGVGTGVALLAGRPAPWPLAFLRALGLAFSACSLGFATSRPDAGLPPVSPSWRIALALAGGLALACAAHVARASPHLTR